MSEIAVNKINDLIKPSGFSCSCGKDHTVGIQFLKIEAGAVESLPKALETMGVHHPYVVCGPNGYEAAGKKVCEILKNAGCAFSLLVEKPTAGNAVILPSEYAAGHLLLNFDDACDLILGVGSGVINDLCKMLGKVSGRPCAIVATAPSMDGYASDSASVEINEIKRSLPAVMPSAIICDTDIMAKAPVHMIHAGLGDLAAKYTSLFDWKLAGVITEEYYCGEIAGILQKNIDRTFCNAINSDLTDERNIRSITEGLILSGMCISFAGISHPASGLEHYFSHCWEMMLPHRGRSGDLHGIQAGVGTVLTLKMIEWLRTIRPTMEHVLKAADSFDTAAWENNLRRVFPAMADELIELAAHTRKNDRIKRLERAGIIIDNWSKICAMMDETLRQKDTLLPAMEKTGMPLTPRSIGLTRDDVIDAFVCSRDIRDKYLLSSMIWDIGYTDEAAAMLADGY